MAQEPIVFKTPHGARALGRNTELTVAHWDQLVSLMPVGPRIFRDAGQPVPRRSPNLIRFHYKSFRSQRSRGFCVGFNFSSTIMTRLRIPDGATPDTGEPLPEIELSALYSYDVMRMECESEGIHMGSGDGGIGSCAIKAAHTYGCVTTEVSPDTPSLIDNHRNGTKPAQSAREFGRFHPVKDFAICESWEHGLELNAGGFPLAVASAIPAGMMNTDAKGRFKMTGSPIGGHEYQIIDHDQDEDLAVIGQCWPNWGEKNSDPIYEPRGGYTQVGFCSLTELRRWFSSAAMSSGAAEITVVNTVVGFAPPILDYSAWD
jgi:hypothetical protein